MDSITPVQDPVTAPLVALLDVYDAHAEALRFPDTDHETLLGLAQEVREAAAEVARHEQALAAARQRLGEGQQALLRRAERGLAYAKIYAQGDATLTKQLDGIALTGQLPMPKRKPKRSRKAPPRARRAKPKAAGDDTVTELPLMADEEPARATA